MTTYNLNDLEQFEQFVGSSKMKIELQNKSGDTAILEVEPLGVEHMGKVMYVQSNIPKPRLLNPQEVKSGREPRYESEESFQARLTESDYNVYGKLFEILCMWIKQSNGNIPDASLRKFVSLNAVVLLEAFNKQHQDIDENTGEKAQVKDFIKMKQEQMNEKASDTKTED